MATVKKDFSKIIAEADRQGWKCEQTGKGGKWKLVSPDGKNIVWASASPSAQRAVHHLIADLRRYGFVWEGR